MIERDQRKSIEKWILMDSLHGEIRWNNLDGLDKLWEVKMDVEERRRPKKGLNVIKKNIKIDSGCINDRRRRI